MFENLSERLETAFKQIKGEGRITELNIAATVKDIRRALIDADVNYKIAKEFTDTVREKALGQKVLTAVSPGQLMVKVVKDELVELMGGSEAELNAKGSPAVILIAGFRVAVKRRFSGKLANYLKTRKGLSPMLVAADIYRPAAIEQLKVFGEQIGVEVYSEPENKSPVEIAQNAIRRREAKTRMWSSWIRPAGWQWMKR
jgi:signal recognition particle subunit SRP54